LIVATILIIVYGLTLLFSLKTHSYLYDVSLAIKTESDSFEEKELTHHGHELWLWIGILLLMTVGVTFESELFVFVAPLLILIGVNLNQEMELNFNSFEVVALAVAVTVTNLISFSGRSNWLDGTLLLATYLILGVNIIMLKQRFSRWFPSILSLLLFGLCFWAINQELRHYQPQEVWDSLRAIPRSSLLWVIALTSLDYWVLTGYDSLGMSYVRHRLPYPKIALTAIISYGVSNSVGFALLSSSAIRYRFYRTWGLSTIAIAQLAAFCNLTFWLGLFTMGGSIFLFEPLAIPTLLNLPFASVRPLGAIFLLIILVYLMATVLGRQPLRIGRWIVPHLPIKLALAQIIVASLDWSLAAAVFYVLISSFTSLSYPAFFGIYLLAQIAGVISNVPGGLGVFETVMLLLLSPSIASSKLLGALLIYRGIYYFLPLCVALLLLGIYDLRQRFS
jgi:uncharacterized membrane protein YbhN (UPF0104 family)